MRFILTGAPGTKKGEMMLALALKHDLVMDDGITVSEEHALGLMADYRVELKLAIDRSHAILTEKENVIFEHSLIDSFAYSFSHLMNLGEAPDQYLFDKWAATASVCAAMLRDSLKYDHIFFLKKDDKDQVEYTIESALDSFSIPHSVLEGRYSENFTNASAVIESLLGS